MSLCVYVCVAQLDYGLRRLPVDAAFSLTERVCVCVCVCVCVALCVYALGCVAVRLCMCGATCLWLCGSEAVGPVYVQV